MHALVAHESIFGRTGAVGGHTAEKHHTVGWIRMDAAELSDPYQV
ncbi:hypothetical protein OH799_07220 [Nocardia sp. NBC_00881]|nr:hypothetical protein OH799_07220 [Nocardia sp. NBC_00881]